MLYGNRDSASVIFLDALADLKDRYLGRFELYHFLAEEEQDIALFNGMLDQAACEGAIAQLVPQANDVDAWFICGPGPMMDAAEAPCSRAGSTRRGSISSASPPGGHPPRCAAEMARCRSRRRA